MPLMNELNQTHSSPASWNSFISYASSHHILEIGPEDLASSINYMSFMLTPVAAPYLQIYCNVVNGYTSTI
ncbi:hypothetical protein K2173_002838 [Erythroxylum novogranatense]|uniref:Uncharacterized protein n=1 Tax=Erythroxylum novogranatense TaxID=1862640 RepID=A0AAV8SQ10_9ROSI|nr:hypothetical protein K2173_002838 [Erythroxylum novogranatense]